MYYSIIVIRYARRGGCWRRGAILPVCRRGTFLYYSILVMQYFGHGLRWCLWCEDAPRGVHKIAQLLHFGLDGCPYHPLQFLYYRIIVRQYHVSRVNWRGESQPQAVKQQLRERHRGAHTHIPLGLRIQIMRDSQRDRGRPLLIRGVRERSADWITGTWSWHGVSPLCGLTYYRNRDYCEGKGDARKMYYANTAGVSMSARKRRRSGSPLILLVCAHERGYNAVTNCYTFCS